MTADLIRVLQDHGARLTRSGDRLRVEASQPILDALRVLLGEHKPLILAHLHLSELADAEGIERAHVEALPAADLEDCAGLPDDALRAYLATLHDAGLRQRGKVPPDETAHAICARCGPICLHPAVATVLPVVRGWPTCAGCPWCHVRNRQAIPRPPVRCGDCRHFARDPINPDAGLGRCTADREPLPSEPPHCPHAQRQCESFAPWIAGVDSLPSENCARCADNCCDWCAKKEVA
ncbi:MAG: hypothetical protein GXC76_10650 [Rhodanobacteraceae bacterium]|jgi:hypothetical protein|nr:hypothetical protein [Rhodanobacteraceae bacterium]